MTHHLLGFDIGGTKCAVIAGKSENDSIEIVDRLEFTTKTELGPEYALNRLEELARNAINKFPRISAIGISCGGPLDSKKGIIMSPPNLNGWDNIHITERFQSRLRLPTYLQNDANACAIAEWKWGAGKGTRNMIFLTFGTGFGAGLILDDKLYTGTNDLAGEIGHVRLSDDGPYGYGKRGSLEGFCSGGGIAQLAKQIIKDKSKEISAKDVASEARAGNQTALEIMDTVSKQLGRGLAVLVDILNPEAIVIGGIFMRAHDLIWPAAERIFLYEALSLSSAVCRVVPAKLGEEIGDYAALCVAAYGVEQQ